MTKAAVITAVKAGYRFIDCANDYDNEHTIGEALKELYAEGVVKRFTYYLRLTIYYLAHQIHQPIPKLLSFSSKFLRMVGGSNEQHISKFAADEYLSRSAHRTPNFPNPGFQFPQFKVLQSVFFFSF